MTYTDHARQRMEERNLPPALIQGVIKYGRKIKLKSGRTRYVFGPVVVISDPFYILTAWRKDVVPTMPKKTVQTTNCN